SRHASLHAKYMVVDRQYVLIGSANIDPRSQLLNTEIGIMVNSPQLAKQTLELFARSSSLENSYHLRLDDSSNRLNWLTEESSGSTLYTTEPGASLLRKLAVEMMSLLPIESLL
ncbi:MAG: phospholipase D family protein, partial [Gammaproteobacteria bacterium]|nr:phospholipase D family protein [Gammaproteobacteria bacterium]